MIDCRQFLDVLRDHQLTFFAGVPDSLLKHFCAAVDDAADSVTCANEGNAVALLAGYHLATGRIGVCYLQNSGLGNAFNPLMSLTHGKVYSIPLLLMVGWRGEPGRPDEPQHMAQGEVSASTLDVLGIEHAVMPPEFEPATEAVNHAVQRMRELSSPYALLVPKGTFSPYPVKEVREREPLITREEALKEVLAVVPAQTLIVSTTGKLSRELFELRVARGEGHGHDFLTVGSMGHASSIALGVALHRPERPVFCLDGDGAALMHMGSLTTIGTRKPPNYYHVIFNNGAHDSVGGQATAGFEVDLPTIAAGCRYKATYRARTAQEVRDALAEMVAQPGPSLLEIRVAKGARSDLGRPTSSPTDNKNEFMSGLS
jgi:phosphonopyruvate decarboxylase